MFPTFSLGKATPSVIALNNLRGRAGISGFFPSAPSFFMQLNPLTQYVRDNNLDAKKVMNFLQETCYGVSDNCVFTNDLDNATASMAVVHLETTQWSQ
jgi:hypothetical protein